MLLRDDVIGFWALVLSGKDLLTLVCLYWIQVVCKNKVKLSKGNLLFLLFKILKLFEHRVMYTSTSVFQTFLGGSSQGCCRLKWGSNGYFCKVQEIILVWCAERCGIELIKEIIYLKVVPQCFRSCQVGRKCLLQLRGWLHSPPELRPRSP